MKLLKTAALISSLLLGSSIQAQDADFIDFAMDKTYPETSRKRTEEFSNYKFGLFVHWGLYSVPAGKWHDGRILKKNYGEWIQYHLKIPFTEYSQLTKEFNPTDFDADRWVSYVKSLGMKYIVITSKHHDGFALFPSDVSEYDIESTPYKKDILGQLKKACDKYGIALGFYYSQAKDWENINAVDGQLFKDLPENYKPDLDKYIAEKSIPQLKELLTRYEPTLIWFDTPQQITPERAQRFADTVNTYSPKTLINSRIVFPGSALQRWMQGQPTNEEAAIQFKLQTKWQTDFNDFVDYISLRDKGIPNSIIPIPFESPDSVSTSYGHKEFGYVKYHTPEELVHRLVKTTARGGNYLLNIGPDGKGNIPSKTKELLDQLGSWMKTNSNAIHNTIANPFGQLFDECEVTYNSSTNTLYLIFLQWPTDSAITINLPQEKSGFTVQPTARVLGSNATTQIIKLDNTLTIASIPQNIPQSSATVIAIQLDTPIK
ncbi:alpha-L-fucosidase [Planctomycetota bacterium]|nr:alpha-L-fucosidase [Planctomycetota bacterium]